MPPAPTKTVYLRKGMKFRALVGSTKGKGKGKSRGSRLQYEIHTGPCAVEMTTAQVLAFKDLLQTTPTVLAESPVEEPAPEPEPEDGTNDTVEDEDTDGKDTDADIEVAAE